MSLNYYKEDKYDDYRKYSKSVLRSEQVQDGGELAGYQPSQAEKRSKSVPEESLRMKNPDGVLSVGVNRKRELIISLTSDVEGPLLRGDRRLVNMDSAKRLRNESAKVYTNSHDENVSAVAYKEKLDKSPSRIISRLKGAVVKMDNAVVEELVPFLTVQEDKKARMKLESSLRDSLESGSRLEYEAIKGQCDLLERRIHLKEREEQRLLQNLTAARGRMEAQARRLDYDFRKAYVTPEPEAGIEDGTDNSSEDNDEQKKQKNGKNINKFLT